MYCPNCGKLNDEGDQYCAFCGAPLIDNQNFEDPVSLTPGQVLRLLRAAGSSAFGFVKRHAKAFAIVVAVVIVVVVANSVLSARFSPKGVAERYFKAMMTGDADAAYECVDIVASPFTSSEKFAQVWEDLHPEEELYNYSIQDNQASLDSPAREDSIEHTFTFRYFLRGSSESHTATVTVVEGTGGLPFMKTYKVLPDFQLTGYTITVPEGSTVTLDGQTLDTSEEEDGMTVYRVPAIFTTDYDITIENPLCDPQIGTIYPDASGFQLYDIAFGESTCTALYDLALGQMDSIMASVLSYGDMPQDIALAADSDATDTYYDLRDNLVQPSQGTGMFQFSRTSAADDSYDDQTFSSGDIYYTCRIDYEYTYSYTRRRWNDELDTTTNAHASNSGEFRYVYQDGQWLLESFWLGIYL